MSTMQLIGTGFATVLTPIGILLMFVGVAVIGLIGLLIDWITAKIEKRVLYWNE